MGFSNLASAGSLAYDRPLSRQGWLRVKHSISFRKSGKYWCESVPYFLVVVLAIVLDCLGFGSYGWRSNNRENKGKDHENRDILEFEHCILFIHLILFG